MSAREFSHRSVTEAIRSQYGLAGFPIVCTMGMLAPSLHRQVYRLSDYAHTVVL